MQVAEQPGSYNPIECIENLLQDANIDSEGKIWLCSPPDPHCNGFKNKVKRGLEAIMHGLVCDGASIHDLPKDSRYTKVARSAHAFKPYVPAIVEGTMRGLWYRDGCLPVGIEPITNLLCRSGASNVFELPGGYVLKVTRSRTISGLDPLKLCYHYKREKEIYEELLVPLGVEIPPEEYAIVTDPRTRAPTVAIFQPYIDGLKDVFDLSDEMISELDPSSIVTIRSTLKLFVDLAGGCRVVPDFMGKNNLSINPRGQVFNIDPHGFFSIGYSEDRDLRIYEYVDKSHKLESCFHPTFQMTAQ